MPRRRRRRTLSPGYMMRLALIMVFVVASTWLTIGVSAANIIGSVSPELALRFQPFDALAWAKAGEQTLLRADARPNMLSEVEALAHRSLRRDPTIVEAWRTLGMTAAGRGDPLRAALMMRFSNELSRRDLATQLWLIEECVQRNDIAGALRHYDAALRTSSESQEILLPILVAATGHNDIIPPLAALLYTRPPWATTFLERLAAAPPDPANLVRLLALSRNFGPDGHAILATAMRSLAARGDFAHAWALYIALVGNRARTDRLLVRNGAFEEPNAYVPFDWQLTSESGLSGDVVRANHGMRAQVTAASGSGGTAARQLLLVPPGEYVFSALAGPLGDTRPARIQWQIHCASGPQGTLSQTAAGPVVAPVVMQIGFRVPLDCPAQWLDLNILPDFEPEAVGAWVDNVQIHRAGT